MATTRGAALAAISLLAFTSSQALAPAAIAQQSQSESSPAAPAMKMDNSALQGAAKMDDSDTMKRADKDMGRVIAKLLELGAKPLGTQSVEETRKGPTPADAVKAVLKDEGKDPDALMAQMNVKKQDLTYPTAGGSQPARIYIPESQGQQNQQGLPVIVYYHGGGWVIADINTYESSPMALAKKAHAIVVSVEYRHAPENKFPAAHEDAFAAYKWVLQNAQQWGGDASRIAVAGESAGGNLATNVAIMARDKNVQAPMHMLLVYPVAGTNMNTPSYKENENAVPLSKAAMEWFVQNTTNSADDLQSPMLDLVGKADLKNLPDATVITAEIDPLMSEGKMLADKLKAQGSEVKYQNFSGMTHEFFGMDAVVKDAERAQDLAARELRDAFTEHTKTTGSTKSQSQKK